MVPPSLYSALTRIRSLRQDTQYIWAAALSINQAEDHTGLAEKSRQVRMMDEIFSRAEEVIIDLGDSDEETDDLLSTLDKYQSVPEGVWSQIDVKSAQSSVLHSIQVCSAMDLPGPDSRFWHAFRRFICRPWFTRVWIVQEYALARRPRFMIGSHFREKQFLPDAISRAAKHLEILYLHDKFHVAAAQPNKNIGDAIWDVLLKYHAVHRICLAAEPAGSSRSLCELLDATTVYFHATKDCDRVYALLGLATDTNIKADIVVDYQESLANFMLRVGQYLVQRQAGKYVLYHSVGDCPDYVSWAIDLRGPPDGLPHLINPMGRLRHGDFNACGPAAFECHFSNLRVGGLTVQACVIDTIQKPMAEGMPHNSELSTQEALALQAMWQMHAVKWMLDVSPTQQLPSADFTRLCWRVIVADLIMPSGNEGQGYRRMRDWTDAAQCLHTVDTVFQAVYRKWAGDLPASYTIDLTPTQVNHIRVYAESMTHTTGRKLAMSCRSNAPCLVPSNSRVGDHVVIVQGCQIPFVLRRNSDDKGVYYRIVGCAYVHDMMDGEIVQMQELKSKDLEIW